MAVSKLPQFLKLFSNVLTSLQNAQKKNLIDAFILIAIHGIRNKFAKYHAASSGPTL